MADNKLNTSLMTDNFFENNNLSTNANTWPSEITWSEMNRLPSEGIREGLRQEAITTQGMQRAGTDPGGGPGGRPPLTLGNSFLPLFLVAVLYITFVVLKRRIGKKKNFLHHIKLLKFPIQKKFPALLLKK